MTLSARRLLTAAGALAILSSECAAWSFFPLRRGAASQRLQAKATGERLPLGLREGDMFPMDQTFATVSEDGSTTELPVTDIFAGQKAVVVTMPKAFSSTCSERHLPSFIRACEKGLFGANGVDQVYVLTTDAPADLEKWRDSVKGQVVAAMADGDAEPAAEKDDIVMLSDASGAFCRRSGLAVDADADAPMLGRSAMLVVDGKIKKLLVDEGTEYTGISGAESMLAEGLKCKDKTVFLALAEELGLKDAKAEEAESD